MRTKNLTSLLAAALICHCLTAVSHAADLLTIGSDAPALDVEHWIHLANGKFEPVTKFEKDKVYVVEFWATWCGPCIASMPHLAELQKNYADQGVQIISISDEDLDTVEKFLEREVRSAAVEEEGSESEDQEPATYRELTSAYCLTTDPDQSSYEDYMQAAAQSGIPTSFIVGKDSKIEWIGHPMELDEPLEAVVEGSWDREAYAEVMRSRQEAEKAMQEIFASLQGKDFDTALKLIDENLAKGDNLQMAMLKLQVLLAAEREEDATSHVQSLFKDRTEKPGETNMIAWNIYEMAAQGRIDSESGLLAASRAAAEAAVEQSEEPDEKASLLDTVAHILFIANDIEEAIAIEKKAISLTTAARDREFFENFLKELQAAKESANKEAAQSPGGIEK